MMADTTIYFLACKARTKLSWEASSNDMDLRRILGHANVLDYLTAELVNLGYEWNSDDTCLEDELVTPSGHIRWTDQFISGTEDDCDLGSWEDSSDSDDSEVPDCEDSSDDSESDSAESFEGYDNDDSTCGKHVYTSTAQISRAHSSKTAIQVAVQEINEFDMTSHQKLGLRGGWDKLRRYVEGGGRIIRTWYIF